MARESLAPPGRRGPWRRRPGAQGLRRRIRRDEAAQMMLFGAVVILLSFLALAGAVVRISQLASETLQEQDTPLLLEVDAVAGAVDEAVRVLVKENQDAAVPECEQGDAIAPVLTDALNHLKALEGSRGFLLRSAGDYGADPAQEWFTTDGAGGLRVAFQLGDGKTRVTVTGLEAFPSPDMVCPPP